MCKSQLSHHLLPQFLLPFSPLTYHSSYVKTRTTFLFPHRFYFITKKKDSQRTNVFPLSLGSDVLYRSAVMMPLTKTIHMKLRNWLNFFFFLWGGGKETANLLCSCTLSTQLCKFFQLTLSEMGPGLQAEINTYDYNS